MNQVILSVNADYLTQVYGFAERESIGEDGESPLLLTANVVLLPDHPLDLAVDVPDLRSPCESVARLLLRARGKLGPKVAVGKDHIRLR